MNETLPSDEIDLLQLIKTIWDGKWRVIAITAAFILGLFNFQFISPTPSFVTTTEIKPISSKEADEYASLNSLELSKIMRKDLYALYNERLTQPNTLVKPFKEQVLLDRQEFDSEGDHNFALRPLAGKIALLLPANVDGRERGEQRRYLTLSIKYNDEDKWLSALN